MQPLQRSLQVYKISCTTLQRSNGLKMTKLGRSSLNCYKWGQNIILDAGPNLPPNFWGPNLPQKQNWGPICHQNIFWGPLCRNKKFRELICLGPICQGTMCRKKMLGPNLARTPNSFVLAKVCTNISLKTSWTK